MNALFPSVLVVLALGLASCGPAGDAPTTPSNGPTAGPTASTQLVAGGPITPQEVHTRVAAGETIVILDVRTPEENAQSRIPGSVLIPHDQVAAVAATRLPDRNAFIAVYCRSGRRSGLAIQDLQRLGYTRVYNLGGLGDWPYATEP